MARVLGETIAAPLTYSPEILEPIPRSTNRDQLNFGGLTHLFGADVWHLYEMSWLEPGQRPVSYCGVLVIPCDSPATVESKSLKLYLNSLNFHEFTDSQSAVACITNDLSALTGAAVGLQLLLPTELDSITQEITGEPIALPPEHASGRDGSVPCVLQVSSARTNRTLVSHNLRSLCPVTGQPDWATLVIDYEGLAFDCASLTAYVHSYRTHQEYHEQCVERIFADLYGIAEPSHLSVVAFYQRRGGIDITPWRSMLPINIPTTRTGRQ